MQHRLPERSHIAVKFGHEASLSKILHDSGEGDDAAPCKRFDEQSRGSAHPSEPSSDMWDQPRLAAGIPEQAALRDSGNVHGGNRRQLNHGTMVAREGMHLARGKCLAPSDFASNIIISAPRPLYPAVRRLAAKWLHRASVRGGKARPKDAKLVT